MAIYKNTSPIVTNGLVLALDAANPKSYVSGSTTWFDISGNRNSGSLVNGPTYSTNNGGAIVFDGSNDLISIPFALDTSTNFTIEVTAKCNTMTSDSFNRQCIWSFSSGSSQGYQLLDLNVWFDGLTSDNGNNTSFTSPLVGSFIPVNANNIKVYTLSKSGSTQSWYIDSMLKQDVPHTYNGVSEYFKICSRGSGATGLGSNWNGLVYSAKIYNRALTRAEVLQNYNATKGRFGL